MPSLGVTMTDMGVIGAYLTDMGVIGEIAIFNTILALERARMDISTPHHHDNRTMQLYRTFILNS